MIHSCGLLHMDEQRTDDQLEPIYNSSVQIQDIAVKTSREWWTIETGGERGSGRSMLAVQHDDDDDDVYLLSMTVFKLFPVWEKCFCTHIQNSNAFDSNTRVKKKKKKWKCQNCSTWKQNPNNQMLQCLRRFIMVTSSHFKSNWQAYWPRPSLQNFTFLFSWHIVLLSQTETLVILLKLESPVCPTI